MKRYGSELIFISRIKKDGSGTTPVKEGELKYLEENEYANPYKLQCLSISAGTFLASNGGTYVVKLKNPPPPIWTSAK